MKVLTLICLSVGALYAGSVSEQALIRHVDELTSTGNYRSIEHPATLDTVADYIDSVFTQFTTRVERQVFEVDGEMYQNVIASFGPEEGKRIIVGAHYDVCYDQPGADDNASGVAALLELASILNQFQEPLDTRIDLVAFTLEEPPTFRTEYMGSAIHATSLFEKGVEVKVMVCLEMLGYFDETPGSQSYPVSFLEWFFPNNGDFIAVISNFKSNRFARKIARAINRNSDMKAIKLAAPASLPGVDFSDHLNYWGHGYKAIMITDTAFYRNPNYHQESDTPATLDFEKMAEIVQGLGAWLERQVTN